MLLFFLSLINANFTYPITGTVHIRVTIWTISCQQSTSFFLEKIVENQECTVLRKIKKGILAQQFCLLLLLLS